MKINASILFLLIPIALCLTSCAQDFSSNTYDQGVIGETQTVDSGVIIDAQPVKIEGKSGLGGLAGAGAGAVAGSAIGGDSRSNLLGGIAGGIAGAVIGDKIDKSVNSQNGMRYVIKLDEAIDTIQTNIKSNNNKLSIGSGPRRKSKIISIVQGLQPRFQLGQKVLILDGGTDRARVIADNNDNINKNSQK